MERLTRRTKNGGAYHDLLDVSLTCDRMMSEVLFRLAAYEDTGLTPCEIEEMLHDTAGPLHRKLGEWIDADASGRLVVLPCKVGDTVHFAAWFGTGPHIVTKITESWLTAAFAGDNRSTEDFRPSDFGKTVFLTREEAEKALEVRDG